MKTKFKTLLAAVLILLTVSTAAFAKGSVDPRCKSLSLLAATVMRARQDGVDINRIVGIVASSPAPDIGKSLVIEAYKTPIYPTPALKKAAVRDFLTRVAIICYEQ